MSASRRPTLAPSAERAKREVDGGGGFSDPALARGDGDDVLDIVDRLQGLLHRVGDHLGANVDLDHADAVHRLYLPGDGSLDGLRDALRREAEDDLDLDLIPLDVDALDALGAYQVTVKIGLDILLDRGFDTLFGNF